MARPAPLAPVRGAFGVYVTGTSMEPEFRQGDIALVKSASAGGRKKGAVILCRAARLEPRHHQMAAAPDRRQVVREPAQPAARHEQGFHAVAQGMAEGAAG